MRLMACLLHFVTPRCISRQQFNGNESTTGSIPKSGVSVLCGAYLGAFFDLDRMSGPTDK
jgi:hypothetical protein